MGRCRAAPLELSMVIYFIAAAGLGAAAGAVVGGSYGPIWLLLCIPIGGALAVLVAALPLLRARP
jgi:hypothetical protein